MPEQLAPPASDPIRFTQSPEPDDGAHGSPAGLEMNSQLRPGDDEHDPADYEYAVINSDELDERELELSNAFRRNDDLHPVVQGLSIADVEACLALETATFPENERCTREKFQYRLTACPSLSLGVFSTTDKDPTPESKPAYDAARAPDSTKPGHRSILVGHVIGTMTTADTVTDASMGWPESFTFHENYNPNPPTLGATAKDTAPPDSKPGLPAVDQSGDAPGHHPDGRTVAIHSVAVLPLFQGSGLGKMVLRSYLQRIESAGIADKAVLLAHPEMVPFYTDNFGFEDTGESKTSFAGGGWRDMVYRFNDLAHWD